MKQRIKAWLPKPESIRNNRWLRWMGPLLSQQRLWHFSRKGIAMGVAVGVFFGLLLPVAQIPVSAAVAVLLRANLPMAVASTLVTNPVTFGPVYYGAYRLGKAVLGEPEVSDRQAKVELDDATSIVDRAPDWNDRLAAGLEHLKGVGKPMATGLAIVASVSGLAVYFLVSGLWVIKTRHEHRRRLRKGR